MTICGVINGNGNGDAHRPEVEDRHLRCRADLCTHIISDNSVLNIRGLVFRRDAHYLYYPSKNPLADLGPIQQETVAAADAH